MVIDNSPSLALPCDSPRTLPQPIQARPLFEIGLILQTTGHGHFTREFNNLEVPAIVVAPVRQLSIRSHHPRAVGRFFHLQQLDYFGGGFNSEVQQDSHQHGATRETPRRPRQRRTPADGQNRKEEADHFRSHFTIASQNQKRPPSKTLLSGCFTGTPGRIRTFDLRLRRPLLYPAELLARELAANVPGNSAERKI